VAFEDLGADVKGSSTESSSHFIVLMN